MTSPAERYAAARRRGAHPALADFAAELGFALDPFQVEACEALEDGYGVLVCAPTGAGKTVVGEFAVHLALAAGPQVLLHDADQGAVEPEVQRPGRAVRRRAGRPAHRRQLDQRRRPGRGDDHRGAAQHALRRLADAGRARLRGDGRGALPGRPVPRRGLGGGDHPPARSRCTLVVAVGDRVQRRGVRRLAGHRARRDRRWSSSEQRPVPLWQHMLVGKRMFDLFSTTPTATPRGRRWHRRGAARASRRDGGSTRADRRPRAERRSTAGDRPRRRAAVGPAAVAPAAASDVIERLDRDGLLPAITFIFSRAGCDAAVAQCLRSGLRLTTEEERAEIRAIVDERARPSCPSEDLRRARLLGVARRRWSAGSPPTTPGCCRRSRRPSRSCSSRGLVKAVFATETLALGINMPARTRGAGAAGQVQRRGARRPDAGGVHPAHRPGRPPRHRRRGPRRRAVVAGDRPAAVAGLASTRTYPLRSSFRPSLQHGGQPGRPARAGPRPGSCWSRRSRSSRRTGRWSAWPAQVAAQRARGRAAAPPRCTATAATSPSTSALRREIADRERALSRESQARRRRRGRRDPGARCGPAT